MLYPLKPFNVDDEAVYRCYLRVAVAGT